MLDIYAVLLLIAVSAVLLTFAVGLAAKLSWTRPATSAALVRVALAASAIALASLLGSTAAHLSLGHRPGTATALGPGAFIAEHPAILLTAVAAVVALWWSARPR